jgi:hypothetical protein
MEGIGLEEIQSEDLIDTVTGAYPIGLVIRLVFRLGPHPHFHSLAFN